jgi:hypothetical protein
MLCNTRYDFEHLRFCIYFIECGVSPARNFEPAIQINDGCDHRISFNVFEWLEFTKTLIHIIEEEEKEITTQFWENFTINVIPINYKSNDSFKTRKITLTKNSTYLMLMEGDIIEILRIDTLLSAKLEMLHKLIFFTYYYNLLKSVNRIMMENNCNNLSVIEIARIVCNSNNSVENYCMQECLFYLSERVMYDFNNYKIKYF